MSEYKHFSHCTAEIHLAGDVRQVVHRGPDSPVSFPEVAVLQHLHGEDAVQDVRPIGHVLTSPAEEKSRLRAIYGDVVGVLYPGVHPAMVALAPGHPAPKPSKAVRDAKAQKERDAEAEDPDAIDPATPVTQGSADWEQAEDQAEAAPADKTESGSLPSEPAKAETSPKSKPKAG